MRTTHLALTGIALIIAAGFYLMMSQLLQDSRIEVYQATEETLVDTANVLAALVEGTLHEDKPDMGALGVAFKAAGARKLNAQIQSLTKERVGLQVYVTDADGVVLYDSLGKSEGEDFSKWNDVMRTLKGQYGARATRLDAADPMSSVMHVAAPIMSGDKIVGVLTVVKSKADQAPLVKEQRRRIFQSGLLIGGGLLLFVGAVFFWLFRPMRQLSEYAENIGSGKRQALPRLGHGREARTLGLAMEKMREELEGREYAGQYIRTLTHELKSPLSAIQGAAELLQEEMPEEQRQRFLNNIRIETERAERLIRRLLRLSEVERLKSLESRQEISVAALMGQLRDDATSLAASRNVSLKVVMPDGAALISGTGELLRSALLNLLENAIDFSPPGGTVEFTFAAEATFTITDQGPGIPDYAQAHLFERFYSLKHAQTNRRGTGLGLCFVKEVAMLHGAEVRLVNRPAADGTGAVATFQIR